MTEHTLVADIVRILPDLSRSIPENAERQLTTMLQAFLQERDRQENSRLEHELQVFLASLDFTEVMNLICPNLK